MVFLGTWEAVLGFGLGILLFSIGAGRWVGRCSLPSHAGAGWWLSQRAVIDRLSNCDSMSFTESGNRAATPSRQGQPMTRVRENRTWSSANAFTRRGVGRLSDPSLLSTARFATYPWGLRWRRRKPDLGKLKRGKFSNSGNRNVSGMAMGGGGSHFATRN